jgi:hypothetical protein
VSKCRSCGAEIIWAVTKPGGQWIPLDAEPADLRGLYRFDNGHANRPPPLRMTHFATCPHADEHRKAK